MSNFLSMIGSERPGSFNASTVALIEQQIQANNDTVTRIDLAALALPIYSQVLEHSGGQPSGATALRAALSSSQGLIIGSPEYNGFMPPLLLNALTWATRGDDGQSDLSVWRLKPCLITASSPGPIGGIRGAGHLATFLLGIGASVYPDFFIVPNAMKVFDGADAVNATPFQSRAEQLVTGFKAFAER